MRNKWNLPRLYGSSHVVVGVVIQVRRFVGMLLSASYGCFEDAIEDDEDTASRRTLIKLN